MAEILTEKQRKALGPFSQLTSWRGAVHFRVHAWHDDEITTAYCETRAEAEQLENEWLEQGWDTSGVQTWKGRCPTDEEIAAAQEAARERAEREGE